MDEPWFYAVWVAGAYFLGSVSVGDLVARAKGVDIRSVGTGNPGAANIRREIGPRYGVLVFLLDIAKGISATLPIYAMGLPTWVRLAAAAALITGHLFPVFWRFRGGTGMASGIGTTGGILPLGVLVAAGPALIFFAVTKNPGYTGGLYFIAAIVAGGVLHGDLVGVVGLILLAVAVFTKSLVQYRGR